MTTPPRPERFAPDVPPPGVELKLISFWRDRPRIVPRLQLVHTNGASREGTIQSAFNWANQPGSGHTIPHIQFDRDGRAAMFLPSDRKGIANYKAADFSLGFETADTGYLADPTISAFTAPQAEKIAVALAYYSILHEIPLQFPTAWDGSGTASHTEPFGYPYWTNSNGKICPGLKKKQQVRELIIPRAREIVAAWTAPPPDPTPVPPIQEYDTMIPAIGRCTDGAYLAQFEFRGPISTIGSTADHDVTQAEVFGRGGGRAFDVVEQKIFADGAWNTTAKLTQAQLRARLAG